MIFQLWVKSPFVRHDNADYDIFGPKIVLESDSGFAIINAEDISSVIVLTELKHALELNYNNGDKCTYHEIADYDYNEMLCWATANNLMQVASNE